MSQHLSMEVQDTEDWAFRSIGGEFGLKLLDEWPEVPDISLKLFATAPSTGRFVAAGPKQFVYGSTLNLFESLAENSRPEVSVVSHPGILQLVILANGVQLATYDSADCLSVYDLSNGDLEWQVRIPNVTSLIDVPFRVKLAFVASNKLWELGDELREICHASFAAYDSSGCNASSLGNEVTYGTEKMTLPAEVCGIDFAAEDKLVIITGNNAEYTPHVWDREEGLKTITDVAEPFGDSSRAFSWYSGSLNWVKPIWVATAAASSDMSLATSSTILVPYEDADRAMMPVGESESSPVGASLDYSVPLSSVSPFPGIDEGGPSPVWWVLTNEGRILGWHLVSRLAMRMHSSLPKATAAPGSVARPQSSAVQKIVELATGYSAGNLDESEQETVKSNAMKENGKSEAENEKKDTLPQKEREDSLKGQADSTETKRAGLSTEPVNASSGDSSFPGTSSFGSTGSFGKIKDIQFAESSTSHKPKTTFSFSAPPAGAAFANFANNKSSPFGLLSKDSSSSSTSKESPFASFSNTQTMEKGTLFSSSNTGTQRDRPYPPKKVMEPSASSTLFNQASHDPLAKDSKQLSTSLDSEKSATSNSEKNEKVLSNDLPFLKTAKKSPFESPSSSSAIVPDFLTQKNTGERSIKPVTSSSVEESDTTEASEPEADANEEQVPSFGELNLNEFSSSRSPRIHDENYQSGKRKIREKRSLSSGPPSVQELSDSGPTENPYISKVKDDSTSKQQAVSLFGNHEPNSTIESVNTKGATKSLSQQDKESMYEHAEERQESSHNPNSSSPCLKKDPETVSGGSGRSYDPVEATEWDGAIRGYMLDILPCALPDLGDLDQFYAETNSMFQVLDHNLNVLTEISKVDGGAFPNFEQVNYGSEKLNLEFDAGAELSQALAKVKELRNLTTASLDETVSIGTQVASFEAELSKDAYLLRPLTLHQSEARDILRRKLALISDKLEKAESELFVSWVFSGRSFNIADVAMAVKKLDSRISDISRRVNRLPRKEDNTAILSQLSLNDPAEIIDMSLDYTQKQKRVRNVCNLLAKRDVQSIMQ